MSETIGIRICDLAFVICSLVIVDYGSLDDSVRKSNLQLQKRESHTIPTGPSVRNPLMFHVPELQHSFYKGTMDISNIGGKLAWEKVNLYLAGAGA